MAIRGEIVRYLNDLLRCSEFKDYTSNGLQIEGAEEVQKIGFAVDPCLQVFEELADCQMIVTHHGLWWPSTDRLVGWQKHRINALMSRNISLYAAHLPLDRHPQVGNNAQILQKMGYEISGDFGEVGWYAELSDAVTAQSLIDKFSRVIGAEVKSWLFGETMIQRFGVSSGGGGLKELEKAREKCLDLYFTGESSHSMYHAAREMGANVAFGGHYRTEVFGVQALMPLLEENFGVKTRFLDCPTGC
ncbi:MAG: Nif3-like dinuclear metal center hexameric protein [bacterium]|nr:Nif3-like dinuclear metal center hexameric protein [bacterium]